MQNSKADLSVLCIIKIQLIIIKKCCGDVNNIYSKYINFLCHEFVSNIVNNFALEYSLYNTKLYK